MKKSVLGAIGAASVMTFVAFAPAEAGMAGLKNTNTLAQKSESLVENVGRRHRRRARRGLAIGAGLLALGLLAATSRRSYGDDHYHYRDRHYSDRHDWRRTCRRWRRWCRRGDDRACWRFDTRC